MKAQKLNEDAKRQQVGLQKVRGDPPHTRADRPIYFFCRLSPLSEVAKHTDLVRLVLCPCKLLRPPLIHIDQELTNVMRSCDVHREPERSPLRSPTPSRPSTPPMPRRSTPTPSRPSCPSRRVLESAPLPSLMTSTPSTPPVREEGVASPRGRKDRSKEGRGVRRSFE